MFKWNVEEMKLMNMERVGDDCCDRFACESEVSIEDKVDFLDRVMRGEVVCSEKNSLWTLLVQKRENLPKLEPDDIDRFFHEQLLHCLCDEVSYFKQNDPGQKLIQRVAQEIKCCGIDLLDWRPNKFKVDEMEIMFINVADSKCDFALISANKEMRILTLEEVKELERVLEPVYEQYKKYEKALKKAEIEFAKKLNVEEDKH